MTGHVWGVSSLATAPTLATPSNAQPPLATFGAPSDLIVPQTWPVTTERDA